MTGILVQDDRDVLLVIEVADSSLLYDRTVKLPLYARAPIPECWIVDVNAETVDVYRSPTGDGYAERRKHSAGESIAPVALPDLGVSVAAIFA